MIRSRSSNRLRLVGSKPEPNRRVNSCAADANLFAVVSPASLEYCRVDEASDVPVHQRQSRVGLSGHDGPRLLDQCGDALDNLIRVQQGRVLRNKLSHEAAPIQSWGWGVLPLRRSDGAETAWTGLRPLAYDPNAHRVIVSSRQPQLAEHVLLLRRFVSGRAGWIAW